MDPFQPTGIPFQTDGEVVGCVLGSLLRACTFPSKFYPASKFEEDYNSPCGNYGSFSTWG